jgi:hypothetical protein
MASSHHPQCVKRAYSKAHVRIGVSLQLLLSPEVLTLLVIGLSWVVWIALGLQAGLLWSAFALRLLAKR